MTKKIKITIEELNDTQKIKVYCDDVFKYEVSKDNTIDAQFIYNSLEYENNANYDLLPIDENLEINYPKIFKPFSELHELYNKIINEINSIEIN